MLQVFRTNQILVALLFVPYLLLLRVGHWWNNPTAPLPDDPGAGIGAEWLRAGLPGADALWTTVGASVLAFLIAQTVINNRLNGTLTLFPGLIFVFLCALLPVFRPVSPALVASYFLLAALGEAFSLDQKKALDVRVFNLGLWLGVAGLFHPSLLLLAGWGVVALSIFQRADLRSVLVLLSGLLLPFWLVGVGYFLRGNLSDFLAAQFAEGFGFLHFAEGYDRFRWIRIGVFAASLAVVVFGLGGYFQKKVIVVQRKISITLWLLGGLVAVAPFQENLGHGHLLLIAVPLSMLLSQNLLRLPTRWSEALHIVALVGLVVLSFLAN